MPAIYHARRLNNCARYANALPVAAGARVWVVGGAWC
eukprot:COSAG01_NODE_65857_length_272_cov_0.583815_1_plen_36_part_10